jgi:hypothetical protein
LLFNVTVYGTLPKDDDALYDLAHRTVQEFEDFKLRYEDYLEVILHG